MTFSLAFLADKISCDFSGPNILITCIKSLKEAQKDHLTFFSNHLYHKDLANTKAGACLVRLEDIEKVPQGVIKVITADPTLALAKLLDIFYPDERKKAYLSESAFISEKAQVGTNCLVEAFAYLAEEVILGDAVEIGANSYLGKGVIIGNNTKIGPNVTINNAIIGNNCLIKAGVRIGEDGFGFVKNQDKLQKIKQIGKVVIGDFVEIGSNSTIDRGALEDTKIGSGTKIDNLVQIAHNVIIGENCIICALAGIAGSTKIGNFTVIGGQAGIAGHLEIGSYVQIAGGSGVINNLDDRATVGGYPATNLINWHKQSLLLAKLLKKE